MGSVRITDDIYYVGVLNPNLRVFDIVMVTEYGTSYNSYVVKGSEKTAVIEAAHVDYFDYYLTNLQETLDINSIDYIIMNHNEPDHSGAVAKLLKINPNITVVATQAGAIYLKNIINDPNFKVQIVKDGDSISLGNKTLKFIKAPFLHWPDTMFTWLEEEKVLFPCDFLGAHYCEPQIMDTLCKKNPAYNSAFKGYYDAIFSPFKKYVLDGLDKIKDLDIQMACTSHGPVLTKEGKLQYTLDKYLEWSTEKSSDIKDIPIFYCSAYGNTEKVAHCIAEGIREVCDDVCVETFDIIKHDMGELGAKLNNSYAFLIGSPTLNKDAVPPVWQLLSHVDAINISNKKAAIFGSYGWSGEAFNNLSGRLTGLKVDLYSEMFKVNLVVSEEDLENARDFGRQFAEEALK